MRLEKSLAGTRTLTDHILSNLGGYTAATAEQLIPTNPRLLEEWLGAPDGTAPKNDYFGFDVGIRAPCRIGILSDIHQNTVFLRSALASFETEGVNVLFCLGDYCYTKKPDVSCIRARQVRKVLELLHGWLAKSKKRLVFVLLGNHEMEGWYFGNEESRVAVQKEVQRWQGVQRMYFQSEPFKSYEVDNAVNVNLAYGGGHRRRSFRLAHAITTEFVEALYMGLDETKAKERFNKIETHLGRLWFKHQHKVSEDIRARWNRFLASKSGTAEFQATVGETHQHLRTEMQTGAVMKSLAAVADGGDLASSAKGYQRMLDLFQESETVRDMLVTFWLPSLNLVEGGLTSLDFAIDIRRLYSSLGVGPMYSLCGHFHADLGMFEASREFGTRMIAVGGSQPRKIIGNAFSAYILECGKETDTLYRFAFPDDRSVAEFGWDLSFPEWKHEVDYE
jgi:hypothetical protein